MSLTSFTLSGELWVRRDMPRDLEGILNWGNYLASTEPPRSAYLAITRITANFSCSIIAEKAFFRTEMFA